jgi:hypothetical protein
MKYATTPFLHIETGLLQFLDRRFGSRVRWIDRHDGIALGQHVHSFVVAFLILPPRDMLSRGLALCQ